jgi:hypothetical protein
LQHRFFVRSRASVTILVLPLWWSFLLGGPRWSADHPIAAPVFCSKQSVCNDPGPAQRMGAPTRGYPKYGPRVADQCGPTSGDIERGRASVGERNGDCNGVVRNGPRTTALRRRRTERLWDPNNRPLLGSAVRVVRIGPRSGWSALVRGPQHCVDGASDGFGAPKRKSIIKNQPPEALYLGWIFRTIHPRYNIPLVARKLCSWSADQRGPRMPPLRTTHTGFLPVRRRRNPMVRGPVRTTGDQIGPIAGHAHNRCGPDGAEHAPPALLTQSCGPRTNADHPDHRSSHTPERPG